MKEKSFVDENKNKFPTLLLSLNIEQYSAEDVEREYSRMIKNLFFNEGYEIREWMVIFTYIDLKNI